MDLHAQRVLIIDFGSQYTQLIARRIREIGVYCEIHASSMRDEEILAFNAKGIILSGGPDTVTGVETPRAPQIIFTLGIPVLGICYGMQTMAQQLGGRVEPGVKREFGYAQVAIREPSLLLTHVEDHLTEDNLSLIDVWMSHGDHVSVLPHSFTTIASTTNCPIAGMASDDKKFYGLQFHPEVSHTRQGKRIFERFLIDICGCEPNWTSRNIIEEQITRIKNTVGEGRVILALSGGVDSSVAAVLLQRALSEKLLCVFVDTGLLRLNEREHVQAIFAQHFGMQLKTIHAEEEFLTALTGETDPENKRKIIGKKFIEIFEREANLHSDIKWLAQGTIYSDVIESAGINNGSQHVIKSHHNVGGLPEQMQLKLIEPLRELFKDEVRALGIELGLPYELIYQHPFPGPGLGVRVLGEVKKEYLEKLRYADAILLEELKQQGLYDKVSQAFAVFLPVKSVGVTGDARHYDHVIAIRVVESIDFMTATWAKIPFEVLNHISNRIINEVRGISRVTYDISSKPPATIEWE